MQQITILNHSQNLNYQWHTHTHTSPEYMVTLVGFPSRQQTDTTIPTCKVRCLAQVKESFGNAVQDQVT